MADVSLDVFLKDIRPHAPGCADEIMKDAALKACIRLCTESWVIREDIEPGDIIAGVDDYLIIPSQTRQMISLVSILVNGLELPKKTEEELDVLDPGWRNAEPGVATMITMTQPDRIRLNRIPDETVIDGFVPRIITKPERSATVVDQRLFDNWNEVVAAGALSTLKGMMDKKWSDPQGAVSQGQMFMTGIQYAKGRSTMGYFKKTTVAQPKRWV